MRKFKKRLFGYSPTEVDDYFAELDQRKKTLADNRKKAVVDEITRVEELLKKYQAEELFMGNLLAGQIAVADDIIRKAEEKSQAMKMTILNELQTYQERLACRQDLLRQVCEELQAIMAKL